MLTGGSRGRKRHIHSSQQLRQRVGQPVRPQMGHRSRSAAPQKQTASFSAPEIWHEPIDEPGTRFVVQPAGDGYVHPVTVEEVRARLALLPKEIARAVQVVQFSRMTRKRTLFPLYGMQWGSAVYLYPIEESLVEIFVQPPRPEQLIEARMYGGEWKSDGRQWELIWTPETIRDFYLNNVLIHEIGHLLDDRNTRFDQREQYANWFAIEYGFRASRGRRM